MCAANILKGNAHAMALNETENTGLLAALVLRCSSLGKILSSSEESASQP